MRPRLEWLETFLAIVETGSLTKAGDRIARSQSAVSLQLRQLEQAVGVRLFRREKRNVMLTAAGEKLVPLAQRAVDAASAVAAGTWTGEGRVIRVGVPEEYADSLIPGLLGDLARRDPELVVEVQCASSRILEHRVRGDQLDMAFALAEEIEGRGELVATDPVLWLQARGGKLTKRRPLPVAVFDQACNWRNRALDALHQTGIDYEIVFTSASVAGVRAGIRSGAAVGVLAASTAGPELQRMRGSNAPPLLAPARLVLLRGDSADDDARLFISGARSQLRRR
jgi:DNA-binding transcriptional LysR family regulator